jgi:hypothetical protein
MLHCTSRRKIRGDAPSREQSARAHDALRKCGVKNPVVLLDEVDKMGHQSMHGDPSAAMLEVLDPASDFRLVANAAE